MREEEKCWKTRIIALTHSRPWVPIGTYIDFTLSNTRRFYSSMGNPLGRKGLTSSKTMSPFNPFPPVSANWHLHRFYSVKRQTILLVNEEPLGQERVNIIKNCPHFTLSRLWVPIGTYLDFTLSNARRFYSSMGKPLGQERVTCIDGFQSRDKTAMLVHKTTANYRSCFA